MLLTNPLLGFDHLPRAVHRAQENRLLMRLGVYYKRIELTNSQMGEGPRARYGQQAGSFHALSRPGKVPQSWERQDSGEAKASPSPTMRQMGPTVQAQLRGGLNYSFWHQRQE